MAFPTLVQAAIDRLANLYNGNDYDASGNPGGMANDGHRINFEPSLRDIATAGDGIAAVADDVAADATAASEGAEDAETARAAAVAARDKSQSWASAPVDTEIEPGLFSARHGAAKALQEADRAAGLASGLDLPEISVADALRFLRVKVAGDGYETAAIDVTPSILRSARTTNTALAKSDQGKLIDITSGSFTQTFAAAATLGDGWFSYVWNSGTGDITIPASDGRMNWIMYPGEVRLFQCDGTALRSIVIRPFTKTFAQSDTFIKPPGYAQFEGIVWNGGNSGAAGANSPTATTIPSGPAALAIGGVGGSGGGAGVVRRIAAIAEYLADSCAVVVGAGGVGTSATTSALGGASSVAGFGNIQNPAASVAVDYLISAAGGPGAPGGRGTISSNDGTAQTRTLGADGSSGASTGFLPGSSGPGGKGGDGASSGLGTAGSDGGNATLRGAGGGGGGGGGGKFTSGDYTTGYNSPAGFAAGGKGGNGMRGEVLLWGVL